MKFFHNKTNFAWCLVILGGVIELFWVSGLKYADSTFWYMLTICGIAFSFICMIVAVRYIEVSIAYAVFVGIGTVGIVIAEMLVFNEAFSFLKLIFIATLLLGIIGLKLVSTHHRELTDKDLATNLDKDLGLDEFKPFSKGEK